MNDLTVKGSTNQCLAARPSLSKNVFDLIDYDCNKLFFGICQMYEDPNQVLTTEAPPLSTEPPPSSESVFSELPYFTDDTELPNFDCILPKEYTRDKRDIQEVETGTNTDESKSITAGLQKLMLELDPEMEQVRHENYLESAT